MPNSTQNPLALVNRILESKKLTVKNVAVALVALLLVVVTLLLVPGGKSRHSVALPLQTWAGPAGIIGGTSQDSQNHLFALVNVGHAANVQAVNITSGKIDNVFPTSNAATSIALSDTDVIAVGTAYASTGSLALYASDGSALKVIPLPGPVSQVVAISSQPEFVTLSRVQGAAFATIESAQSKSVAGQIALSGDSVSIAVSPDGLNLYDLLVSGSIQVYSLITGKVEQTFKASAGGMEISLSADGTALYELKGSYGAENVSVINIATEAVIGVLPAPAHCVAIEPNLAQLQTYDFVGTSRLGNIQLFNAAL